MGQLISNQSKGPDRIIGLVSGDAVSGNPISYYNGTRWTFGWEDGRKLVSASTATDTKEVDITTTYDLNGVRLGKTVVTETYQFVNNHDYVTTVVAPTCTEQGYTLHECSCGDSYQDTVVEALGHNYVLMTETEEGRTYYCTRCGDTHTDDLNPLPTVPVDPPVDVMSLEAGEETTCGGIQRVLVSTVTQEHTYFYASGKLLREIIKTTNADGTVTTETLDFIYNSNGNPYALKYNGTTYYYITNLQGDVMYIVDSNGAAVATYEYDPFGKVTTATGAMASINPLRYRGYYYDAETGFYYLQSRYYDPVICRFINADGLASTGQGFIGYNMFAYCNNNPVNYDDPAGYAAPGMRVTTVAILDGGAPQKEEKKQSGWKTFVDTVAKIGEAAYNNATISGGIGMGLGASVSVLGLGVDADFHGDYLYFEASGGEVFVGQRLNAGITIDIPIFNIGYQNEAILEDGIIIDERVLKLYDEDQREVSLFSSSCYVLFAGYSVDLSFDIIGFFEDIGRMLLE